MHKYTEKNHPNPLFRRNLSYSLNGRWVFTITKDRNKPKRFLQKIEVPFSPETSESGVLRQIMPDDIMHYMLKLDLPEEYYNGKVILHFDKVDQIADVYLNDRKISHHEGGYLPFSVELENLKPGDELYVQVIDDTDSEIFPKGKQTLKPNTIWYKGTSGIWGDVWIEKVPNDFYFTELKISPNYSNKSIKIFTKGVGELQKKRIEIYIGDQIVAEKELKEDETIIDLKYHFEKWSPDNPVLYTVKLISENDIVYSYFAFRKVENKTVNDFHYVFLNEKPIFINALLDQGYYSQTTGMTPLDIDAIENDILYAKESGFNSLRKHVKIEDLRFYYLCDKLGMMVIQDFVSGGEPVPLKRIAVCPFINVYIDDKVVKNTNRKNEESRNKFLLDIYKTVDLLRGFPCIIAWTVFNEGWGQFEAEYCTDIVREIDHTRLIDSTSGWFDQKVGDFDSQHIYLRKLRLRNDGKRILFLSEYGGYSLPINNHTYAKRTFGYSRLRTYKELYNEVSYTYENSLIPLIKEEGLAGAVYTQLSDIEAETNGLMTYDRSIEKIKREKMFELNNSLYKTFDKTIRKNMK